MPNQSIFKQDRHLKNNSNWKLEALSPVSLILTRATILCLVFWDLGPNIWTRLIKNNSWLTLHPIKGSCDQQPADSSYRHTDSNNEDPAAAAGGPHPLPDRRRAPAGGGPGRGGDQWKQQPCADRFRGGVVMSFLISDGYRVLSGFVKTEEILLQLLRGGPPPGCAGCWCR